MTPSPVRIVGDTTNPAGEYAGFTTRRRLVPLAMRPETRSWLHLWGLVTILVLRPKP